MKIDLHVHFHKTSHCAKNTILEMAIQAKKSNLNAIVALDHNYLTTQEDIDSIKDQYNVKIFKGAEINVNHEDIIIITNQNIPFMPKYKEKIKDIKQLSDFIQQYNALSILCHPFRRHDITIDPTILKLHAIEFASRHINPINRPKILEFANKYNLNLVSVSDAHKTKQLGGFCIETKENNINDEIELGNCIKTNNYTMLELKLTPILPMPSINDITKNMLELVESNTISL